MSSPSSQLAEHRTKSSLVRCLVSWSSILVFGLAVSAGTAGGIALADQAQQGMPLPYPLPLRLIGAPANDVPTGEACQSGIAIEIEFGSLCSHTCVINEQCPEGWGCRQVPQGGAPPVGICFPRRIGAPQQ